MKKDSPDFFCSSDREVMHLLKWPILRCNCSTDLLKSNKSDSIANLLNVNQNLLNVAKETLS